MEDVFLTHLEMEFPEFRQISASVRGEFGIPVHHFSTVFFDMCCFCEHSFACLHVQTGLTTGLSLKQINRRRVQGKYVELLSQ